MTRTVTNGRMLTPYFRSSRTSRRHAALFVRSAQICTPVANCSRRDQDGQRKECGQALTLRERGLEID